MPDLQIQHVELSWGDGPPLVASLNAHRNDRYTQRIRSPDHRRPHIADLLLDLTNPSDLIIDAGANIGLITLPLAASKRRVLAIEAQAENFCLLADAILSNRFHRWAHPVHAAIAAEAGVVSIVGASAFARVDDREGGNTPALKLDDIATMHGFEDAVALKIDVEGSEQSALKGMERLLKRDTTSFVVMEGNGAHSYRMGHRVEAIIQPLTESGFDAFMFRGKVYNELADNNFQPFPNVDYLFYRRPVVDHLSGFRKVELNGELLVHGLLDSLTNTNSGYAAHGLQELPYAPFEVSKHSKIVEAVEMLARTSEDEDVRSMSQAWLDHGS